MDLFIESFTQKNIFLRPYSTLVCEGSKNHLIFTKEKLSYLKDTVKKINFSLNKGRKTPQLLRSSIIQLLSLLQQCPESILSAEGEGWFLFCLQNLSNSSDSVVKILLEIIIILLRASEDNKELRKKLSKQSLKLVERLNKCHFSIRETGFRCMYEDLRLYPNQALSQRKYIEKEIMKIMKTPYKMHRDVVYAAASVYAALPVPGGGGGLAAEMKGNQLEQLISLGHLAADAIFYDIKEHEKYNFSRDHKLPIDTIEKAWELKDPSNRIFMSTLVLGNCFDFIKVFFERCLTDHILINPKHLINLVFRILQVELLSLRGKQSTEAQILYFLLPMLYIKAISLLKALIQNLICPSAKNLMEEQLVSILNSTRSASNRRKMKWDDSSTDTDNLTTKTLQTYLSVRIECYEALIEIAKVSNGLSGHHMDDLVTNLKSDLQPVKDTISLNQATPGGNLSLLNTKKKSKKKGYTVTSNQCQDVSSVPLPIVVAQRVPLTIVALDFIETLFQYSHDTCPLMYVQKLQDELVDLTKTQRIGIYGDPRVRESLLRAVMASATFPNPLCPPQYNIICGALILEKRHSRHQVSKTIQGGIGSLGVITANPITTKWSEVVNLNKEILKADANRKLEEPVLNGDDENVEEDDDEALEEDSDDDDAINENDPAFLNMEDDNDEENDDLKINGNDESISDEGDDKKNDQLGNKDEFDIEADKVLEDPDKDSASDDEEDTLGIFDMTVNDGDVEKEESEDEISEDSYELDSLSEDEVGLVAENKEELVEEDKSNDSIGLKRRSDSSSEQSNKKNKVETDINDEDSPSIEQILETFVDADPDSDSDAG